MPNLKKKSKHQILAGREPLKVSDLRNLVRPNDLCDRVYEEAIEKWGSYFQSPVDKVTATEKDFFRFNERGGFLCTDLDENNLKACENFKKTLETLFPQPEAQDPALQNWLRSGEPLFAEKLELVRRRLFADSSKLTNKSLFDQPICRLVHRNQLRRDLDYQVPYQLTPAQVRLIDAKTQLNDEPDLEFLRRNQRWYWGVSETFQSLVALFDSDIGSTASAKPPRQAMTKEFIRLRSEEGNRQNDLAPHELNKSSPLRFWAPPPAFACSVFHMLFWRSVITGRDLFDRPVIDDGEDDTPKNRAEQYYVLVNWFNAAKFRLADYEQLFEALMAIARMVGDLKLNRSTPLHKIAADITLPNEPKGWLYPSYFADSNVTFPRFQRINLVFPFKSVRNEVWELAWEHQPQGDEQKPTTIGDLLIFLRDKALEVIIWSRYQMEVRSVGLIPIQHLYHVELTPRGLSRLTTLADQWKARPKRGTPSEAKVRAEINGYMEKAIFEKKVDKWVRLRKVYGGTYRQINDRTAWGEIKRLSSRRVDQSAAEKEVEDEIEESASGQGPKD
ncbi:MAG TPA: hypothetical protein VJM12_13165 [Pyrinomonadaceae bacterium]|nr:hypothetical protein [Pyrinomonadaceae bacterium]